MYQVLIDVKFHYFKWRIIYPWYVIFTKSHFNIISSWLRELLTEPWWIVELTASAGTPTSLTIPEWIVGEKTPKSSVSLAPLSGSVLFISLNPSGHCWVGSVMSRLATLIHPPEALQLHFFKLVSQYTWINLLLVSM